MIKEWVKPENIGLETEDFIEKVSKLEDNQQMIKHTML